MHNDHRFQRHQQKFNIFVDASYWTLKTANQISWFVLIMMHTLWFIKKVSPLKYFAALRRKKGKLCIKITLNNTNIIKLLIGRHKLNQHPTVGKILYSNNIPHPNTTPFRNQSNLVALLTGWRGLSTKFRYFFHSFVGTPWQCFQCWVPGAARHRQGVGG